MPTGLVVRLTEETDYNGFKMRKLLLINVSEMIPFSDTQSFSPFLYISIAIRRLISRDLNH